MMYDPNDIIFLDFLIFMSKINLLYYNWETETLWLSHVFWLLSYNRETGVTIVTIIITFSKFCHSLVVSINDCGAKGQQFNPAHWKLSMHVMVVANCFNDLYEIIVQIYCWQRDTSLSRDHSGLKT